jgi:hypothetical protein
VCVPIIGLVNKVGQTTQTLTTCLERLRNGRTGGPSKQCSHATDYSTERMLLLGGCSLQEQGARYWLAKPPLFAASGQFLVSAARCPYNGCPAPPQQKRRGPRVLTSAFHSRRHVKALSLDIPPLSFPFSSPIHFNALDSSPTVRLYPCRLKSSPRRHPTSTKSAPSLLTALRLTDADAPSWTSTVLLTCLLSSAQWALFPLHPRTSTVTQRRRGHKTPMAIQPLRTDLRSTFP